LLSPYAEIFIGGLADVNADHLEGKLALNDRIVRFVPTDSIVYRRAFFQAQNNQLAEAKQTLEQAIWSYPGYASGHQQLVNLAEKDPVHFSALLEFALQKEKEHALAVHQ